ncbi:hypothetical protein BGW36DRAFT_355361 [Talaromyces proteolyticus]|uniref:Cyclochlorotine biosynthesis protein O n=1 Tax=Talaromyces proteolyticus TaxID=1131652 RepID=A0AAD4KYP3_9EURO|nr:uncharacterized protein BGW36DRAFT_355361 [Talaromyces proteolyticus]KAH8703975.1 hypothetical protein BGW36DRAFT_355361 [Talaromyces proteolyticus]
MSSAYHKWTRRFYRWPSEQRDSSDEDESQYLTGKHIEPYPPQYDHHTIRSWGYIRGLSASAIVVANVLLFLTTTVILFMFKQTPYSEMDISAYSPLYDRLNIYRSEVHNNFTIYWPDNKPSIFQQRPSPEVDKAWERISSTESIALNADEVRRIGYDPAATWPAPKAEFGEGVYYGVIDVFHQLHCLDILRRTAWPEYYGDMRKNKKYTPIKWEDHLLHCTYVLMRSLTCHADMEVIIGQKFEGWPGLNLNFASTKQCRNFEEILEWKEANTIHQRTPWSVYPEEPIIEQSPEGVLTPYGNHMGLEDWVNSQGIELEIPSGLEWQPTKSNYHERPGHGHH